MDGGGGVTNGFHFVTTDATGAFDLTGDYTCTVNKAVYIVGVGGSPTYPSTGNAFSVNSATVSNNMGTGWPERRRTPSRRRRPKIYIGEQVTLSNLNGVGTTGGQNLQYLDGYSTPVTVTNLTTTTFSVTAPDTTDGIGVPGTLPGIYALTSGTVTAFPTTNPAAVNMAVLGMCPASGTFAGSIPYIYRNEISTVAAAYALSGFGTDAFHVGVNTQGPEIRTGHRTF